MSQTTAVGNGPITFFTTDGKRLLIPLSAIVFDGDTLSIGDPGYAQTGVLAWLQHLQAIGQLSPGTTGVQQAAMVMRGVDPGAWANDIQVKVTYTAASTFDFEVTVTNTYRDLKASTIASVIGTDTAPGSRPGLVHLLATGKPAPVPPTAGSVPLAAGDATHAAHATVPTSAFELEAKRVGAAGNKITATIGDLKGSGANTTFTLTVVYNHKITGQDASAPATVAANINTGFDFVLAVSTPQGGSYAAPAAGTYNLAGGVDIATATGTLVAKS